MDQKPDGEPSAHGDAEESVWLNSELHTGTTIAVTFY